MLECFIGLTEFLLVGLRQLSMKCAPPIFEHVCFGVEIAQFFLGAARP